MRLASPLLSLALIALVPFVAQAADAPKPPPQPATQMAAAPAPTPPATPAASTPAAAEPLTDAQRAAVEDIIKDYLTKKNPEVLMEAMQELQKRQAAETETKNKNALSSDHDKLYADASSPVGGNPKGDVTVVEFFDYQCGYCKMSEPTVEKLLKEDKNVKFIYKDFPILGPVSTTAAKAALASVKQNKYVAYHDALMGFKGHLTDDDVYKVAKDVGLDVDKLKKDMEADDIAKIVEANVALGTDIGARGTPTFVIDTTIVPGAMEYPQLKKEVDDARAANKKP
jgi:protein-disulfide isomerase